MVLLDAANRGTADMTAEHCRSVPGPQPDVVRSRVGLHVCERAILAGARNPEAWMT